MRHGWGAIARIGPVACPEGIEPPTHSLEGCCSIQLSYGHKEQRPEAGLCLYDGRGGGIRTRDPLLPKQMRYQAALRPDNLVFYLEGAALTGSPLPIFYKLPSIYR
jgi:hypothetical protein